MVPFGFRLPRRTQPAHTQDIPEKAAEGIRTLDLLHGNKPRLGIACYAESAYLQRLPDRSGNGGAATMRADMHRYAGIRALPARSARRAKPGSNAHGSQRLSDLGIGAIGGRRGRGTGNDAPCYLERRGLRLERRFVDSRIASRRTKL